MSLGMWAHQDLKSGKEVEEIKKLKERLHKLEAGGNNPLGLCNQRRIKSHGF